MSDYTVPIIIGSFFVVFPLMWFLITRMIMKIAGLSQNVDVTPLGEMVESIGTGSARIRFINLSKCLTVDRYEHGYLLRVWKLAGGGKKVILDNDIVSVSDTSVFFMKAVLMKLSNGQSIRFFGPLGKKML